MSILYILGFVLFTTDLANAVPKGRTCGITRRLAFIYTNITMNMKNMVVFEMILNFLSTHEQGGDEQNTIDFSENWDTRTLRHTHTHTQRFI